MSALGTAVIVVALALVAVAGTVVVLTREPARQAVTLSVFGLLLAVLFFVLQAPDVALAQLAVGTVVVPLMVLLTLSKRLGHRSRRDEIEHRARRDERADAPGRKE